MCLLCLEVRKPCDASIGKKEGNKHKNQFESSEMKC